MTDSIGGDANNSLRRPYNPIEVEQKWYEVWESEGLFKPDTNAERESFSISMPPPNLTGALHYGHAVFVTFSDLMVRWKRMQGYSTLWLPGTDHAAIATNAVLVNQLAKTGQHREDLGRERFEEMFWAWIRESGETIRTQLRRTGASCDWSRERFTMDEGLSNAVTDAFVRLWDKGLIYRGSYLVNWDPADQTAVSDIEVEYREVDGYLWHINYRLENGECIPVATTRPETILGDTAIAVHPMDERYDHLSGQFAIVPFLDRKIPIVFDEYVDREFGSGAVKITPGHDPNDYEMAKRHDLEFINIMNPDGTLNSNAGPYEGVDRLVARSRIVNDLETMGLVVKVEQHVHSIGHGSRSGAVIEPMLSDQWFIDTKPMAEKAAAAVRSGLIRFHPPRFREVFLRWMDEIRDWCISRQLWVGHRLPVWYCKGCNATLVVREQLELCNKCGAIVVQDQDVLDTWFSSGLWTFSTLGWPEDTDDLSRFHPTTVMETGYDIIFFWVARMVMLSLELRDEVPFKDVYLNGLMRREDGSKVSKSNPQPGDDPVEVIDTHGADALRFMIATGSSAGNDMKLVWQRMDSSRNFANKLWNASRFAIEAIGEHNAKTLGPLTPMDVWILGRCDHVVSEVTRLLERFQFGEAGRLVYSFIRDEFCDWYIESTKVRLQSDDIHAASRAAATLNEVLSVSLRVLHPFMPFITEELWSHLLPYMPKQTNRIIVSEWPSSKQRGNETIVEGVEALIEAISSVRAARSELNVQAGVWIDVLIRPFKFESIVSDEINVIARLMRAKSVRIIHKESDVPDECVSLVSDSFEVLLPQASMVDIESERLRLTEQLSMLDGEIDHVMNLLSNRKFISRAPKAVVAKERDRLREAQERHLALSTRLKGLPAE
mgnify:CR=1 FL=1